MMAAIRSNEPMSAHTSWRVGGPADRYVRPDDRDELIDVVRELPEGEPVVFVGLGSNLLVRDGGIRGTVIAVQNALGDWSDLGEGRMHASAGLACTVFARQCVRRGLGPAEFFAGIPGTIGGALRMNAGAFGGETWDSVERVEVLDRSGEVSEYTPADFDIGYRHARRHGAAGDEWFLGATFRFEQNVATSMDKLRALVNERKEKQPLGLPSCGSVFRNPPGDHAARLIEAAGLKGHRIGGAEVSPKHANFIINTGAATAADIEALIGHVQTTVSQRFGVQLVREVHILGETGAAT